MKNHSLNQDQILEILSKAPVGNIATINSKGFPYVVPVHFVYYQDRIYIHGSPKGQKISNILRNEKVCFEIYDMKGLTVGKTPCNTSTVYESIVILGTAKFVDDYILKESVINKIVNKYTPNFNRTKLSDNKIKITGVIEVSIVECTGKYLGSKS